MLSLKLCDDRTEVDLDRLAQAFSIARPELEDRLRLGTITYWYQLGSSNYDTPEMIFHSRETGRRVALDRVGHVISRSDEAVQRPLPEPRFGVDHAAGLGGPLQAAALPASDPTAARPPAARA